MARLPGVNSAPPMPWMTRATMSHSSPFGARPQSAEASANQTIPNENTPLAPDAVAERAGEQQESGQGQRVPRHHPLQRAHSAVERAADGGERDADDGGIERCDPRAEDGGRQHPAPPPCAVWRSQRLGCRGWTPAAPGVVTARAEARMVRARWSPRRAGPRHRPAMDSGSARSPAACWSGQGSEWTAQQWPSSDEIDVDVMSEVVVVELPDGVAGPGQPRSRLWRAWRRRRTGRPHRARRRHRRSTPTR